MITAGQLLDFILEHREDKVFKGFSKEKVASLVREGIFNGTLYYSLSKDNKITGMILAEKREDNVLFILENLSMSIETLSEFAKIASYRFPGMKLEAMRHGQHRKFNTEKLYRKLKI